MANETELGSHAVDPDVLFDALADADRRRVLAGLLDHQTRTVDELVRTLAAADGRSANRRPSDDHSTDAVERHRLRLRHVHLPLLADAGLVNYEPDEDVVELIAERASRETMTAIVDSVET